MTGRDALFEPVRRLFEQVWNQGRLELLDAIATEELVLHAGRNAVSGRGTLRTIIGDFLTGFPDVKHRIEDLVIEGDRVVTRWRGVGHRAAAMTGSRPRGGRSTIPASPSSGSPRDASPRPG